MSKMLIVTGLLTVAVPSIAALAQHQRHSTVQANAVKWSQPAAYAKGAELAVLYGDPAKEGMYVERLRVPAGYKIPAHTHPNDENVTVLSGSFHIGTGDKFDDKKVEQIKAGGYSYVAKSMTHYANFTEDTVLQLHGLGPQGITYVNPADDPRKK